jgi:hypothetical protein
MLKKGIAREVWFVVRSNLSVRFIGTVCAGSELKRMIRRSKWLEKFLGSCGNNQGTIKGGQGKFVLQTIHCNNTTLW